MFTWVRKNKVLTLIGIVYSLLGAVLGIVSTKWIGIGYWKQELFQVFAGAIAGFICIFTLSFLLPYKKRPTLIRYTLLNMLVWFLVPLLTGIIVVASANLLGMVPTPTFGGDQGSGIVIFILYSPIIAVVGGIMGGIVGLLLGLVLDKTGLMYLKHHAKK